MSERFNLSGKKIWVPGASGLVGSALARHLSNRDVELFSTSRQNVDLFDSVQVDDFYQRTRPDVVILAAAKVGGIHANMTYPVDFISGNLQIQQNVIGGAFRFGVKKLLFLASSCIYPKLCPQPMKEEFLLSGPLEKTNEWYAVAKIAGIKLCQAYRKQYGRDFIAAMPTNLYGPNDNFDPENSHVPAGLLQRFHAAKINDAPEVVVWGTGRVFREFLHVDDLAEACLFLLENYSDEGIINIGTGQDISIADFAALVKDCVGFKGALVFDKTRPDGTPRKRLDVSKINALGWTSRIPLKEGLKDYYRWYLEHHSESKHFLRL